MWIVGDSKLNNIYTNIYKKQRQAGRINEERMQYSVSLEYVARIHMFISVLMKEQWKRLCARETLRKTKNIYFIVRVYTRSDVSQELVKKKNKKKAINGFKETETETEKW